MGTWLRSFDARPKIALWASVVATALLLPRGEYMAAYLAVILAGVVIPAGCTRPFLAFSVRFVLPTAFMLILVYGLLVPDRDLSSVITVGGLNLSVAGIYRSLAIAARLLVIGAATVVFVRSTPLIPLAEGLRAMRLPSSLAAILVSSFNMHGLVAQKIHQIADAQRSRGLLPRGVVHGRLRMYVPLLRPLLFGLLQSAIERASLWQSRGYLRERGLGRASLQWRDIGGMGAAGLLVLCGGILRWLG